MGQIKVTKAPIEGLYIIEPTKHGDQRGYFVETYNARDMKEAGLDMVFVQDNQSMSVKGVLRGREVLPMDSGLAISCPKKTVSRCIFRRALPTAFWF